jgi:hypothetical protein
MVETVITNGYMVGNGLKQGDGLAPILFDITLQNVPHFLPH